MARVSKRQARMKAVPHSSQLYRDEWAGISSLLKNPPDTEKAVLGAPGPSLLGTGRLQTHWVATQPAISENPPHGSSYPFRRRNCRSGLHDDRGNSSQPPAAPCTKIVLTGQAAAGHEWSQPIGQGWFFRVLPIQPGSPDTPAGTWSSTAIPPAGFPTRSSSPPRPTTPSANARSPPPLASARRTPSAGIPAAFTSSPIPKRCARARSSFVPWAVQRSGPRSLEPGGRSQEAEQRAARNQSQVFPRPVPHLECQVDARNCRCRTLRPQMGASILEDAAHYRALRHRSGHPIAAQLDWISFSITLWLPSNWPTPSGLHASRASCAQ